jgi:hypothetical protein
MLDSQPHGLLIFVAQFWVNKNGRSVTGATIANIWRGITGIPDNWAYTAAPGWRKGKL